MIHTSATLRAALGALLLLAPAPSALTRAGSPPDSETGRFDACGEGRRITCVVDGDTFWYRGVKIRIADINAPESSSPGCEEEARLAQAATRRLLELLNSGPFSLAIDGRDTDRYGRALRVVIRRGQSLGAMLEREGLAERWRGRRRNWCVDPLA